MRLQLLLVVGVAASCVATPHVTVVSSGKDGGSDERASEAGANVAVVSRSSGCGMALPADQPMTIPGSPNGYLRFSVMQTGATLGTPDDSKAVERTFWVRVPADYDPNTPLRVVYIGQGCGEGGNANLNTYALFDESSGGTEEAIYVAVDLPPGSTCYDIASGVQSQEWEAFQLFHDVVESHYCADNNRIFVAHWASDDHGRSLADMWGCYFAGIPTPPRKFAPRYAIRGEATVSNDSPPTPPPLPCNGPVAGIWIHDTSGSDGDDSLDVVLAANGCTGSPAVTWPDATWTEPNAPPPCVQYVDCPKEYPVVFCKTVGEGADEQSGRAISAFRRFFDMMNPVP